MGTRLFVGNLSFQTSEETLQGLFAAYGTVKAANVITDRDSGRSKGFAFVEMSTEAEAQAATAGLNGKTVDDRQLTVAEAQPRAEGGQRRGGGGGGGYGGDRGGRGGRSW
jgi:RNA recognition motif-containing protein